MPAESRACASPAAASGELAAAAATTATPCPSNHSRNSALSVVRPTPSAPSSTISRPAGETASSIVLAPGDIDHVASAQPVLRQHRRQRLGGRPQHGAIEQRRNQHAQLALHLGHRLLGVEHMHPVVLVADRVVL